MHDQDLLGLADDAARAREVAGERLAQLGGAARRLIGEAPHREAPRAAAEQTRPGVEREVGVRRLAVAEVVAAALAPRGSTSRGPARTASRQAPPQRRQRGSALGRRSAAGSPSAARRGPSGSASATKVPERERAAGVALGDELLAGLEHGVARDAELAGERARRRQPRAGREATRRGSPPAARGRAGGGGRLRRRVGASIGRDWYQRFTENVDLSWAQSAAILLPMTTPTPLERLLPTTCGPSKLAFCGGRLVGARRPTSRDDAVHVDRRAAVRFGAARSRPRRGDRRPARAACDGIDRRFDVRIPEVIEGPVTRAGRRLDALPPDAAPRRPARAPLRGRSPRDATATARSRSSTSDSRDGTARARRRVPRGARGDACGRPARASAPPRDARDRARPRRRRRRARSCAATARAKSEQDVGAALALCSEDFALETVAFGIASRDRKEAEQQLALFFQSLPGLRGDARRFRERAATSRCLGSRAR